MKSLLSLFIFIGLTTTVFAEPVCEVSNAPKIYRLDLTVPATFCMHNSEASCKTFPKESLIQLHGLWPNYKNGGYPSGNCSNKDNCVKGKSKKYCKYPVPEGLYSSTSWETMSGYMAGVEKCLERHEWVKHGTCSPMEAVEYFRWALTKTKYIATALPIIPDSPMTQKSFNQMVATNLPDLNGAIHVKCNGKNVSSMFILYEWGSVPGKVVQTKNGKNQYNGCGKQVSFPSKPKG